MKVTWISHCTTDKEKEEVKASLIRGTAAFQLLSSILDKKRQSAQSTPDYDSPSWAFKEADRQGYHRALSEIQQLINSI